MAGDCAGGERADSCADGDGQDAYGIFVVPGQVDAGTGFRVQGAGVRKAGNREKGGGRKERETSDCGTRDQGLGRSQGGVQGGVCVAAEGAGGGRGAEPEVAAGGDGEHGAADGGAISRGDDPCAYGGYAASGTGAVCAASGRHSDHYAREPVSAADFAGFGSAAFGGYGDHR